MEEASDILSSICFKKLKKQESLDDLLLMLNNHQQWASDGEPSDMTLSIVEEQSTSFTVDP